MADQDDAAERRDYLRFCLVCGEIVYTKKSHTQVYCRPCGEAVFQARQEGHYGWPYLRRKR